MAETNTVRIRAEDGNIIELEVHDSLPSAAALARQYAIDGYPDRYAVFCEKQSDIALLTGEKHYAPTEGVFLSLILRPSLFLSQSGFLGILAATALASALEEHAGKNLGIAWLSDIYSEHGKIGSVAIEGKLDSLSFYEYIIVHFAVRTGEEDFPARLDDLLRKVFESENTSVHMIMAKTILTHFFRYYPDLKTPEAFLDAYKDKFFLRGMRIRFLQDGKKHRAKVLGIENATGMLLLEHKGKTVKITSPKQIFLPRNFRYKLK